MRAINLLPKDDARRKRGRPSLQAQLTLVAPVLVAAVVGSGYLVTSAKVGDARATLQALQDELAHLPRPKQVQVDPALLQQHDERVAALADALQQRVAWDRVLRQIASILPEDVWLTSLAAESPTTSTTTASPAPTSTEGSGSTSSSPESGSAGTTGAPPTVPGSGTPLTVVGYTYSQEGVARFLARLAVVPELTQVRLKSSDLEELAGREVVKFTIAASVRRPGADS